MPEFSATLFATKSEEDTFHDFIPVNGPTVLFPTLGWRTRFQHFGIHGAKRIHFTKVSKELFDANSYAEVRVLPNELVTNLFSEKNQRRVSELERKIGMWQ